MSEADHSDRAQDRKLLLCVALASLGIVGVVVVGVIWRNVDATASTILGTIVGGLLVNSKDVIQAIKEAWQQKQVERMSDQISSSTPIASPVVADTPTGAPGDPVHVTEDNAS